MSSVELAETSLLNASFFCESFIGQWVLLQYFLAIHIFEFYFPFAYQVASALGSFIPKFNYEHDTEESKNIKIVEDINVSFIDDRRAVVSEDDISMLLNKGYDKYRFVSKEFLKRN